MSKLSVGILGLDRVGASIGLALRRYMQKGGKHQFEIVGHDLSSDAEKQAQKMGAIDKIERRQADTAANRDIVILNWSYDELKPLYKLLGTTLRPGCVVLDLAPLKQPALAWARDALTEDQHHIGITPILNPRYLFNLEHKAEAAEEDLFDNSAIVLSPAANCAKDAVDLAFNFCAILGSKPRFLDPAEHDTLLTLTEGVPRVLGATLFYMLMHNPGWGDIQWFTNPDFAALTRPLRDIHPDALRDEWLHSRETLARALDETITTLQAVRGLLAAQDRDGIEALLAASAEEYEKWINHRYNADWDKEANPVQMDAGSTIMGTLLGGKLANRLTGKKDSK